MVKEQVFAHTNLMTTILLGMALMKLSRRISMAPTRNGIMFLHFLSQKPWTTVILVKGTSELA